MKRVKHLKKYKSPIVVESKEDNETPLDPISDIAFFGKSVRRIETSDSIEKKRNEVNEQLNKNRCVIL